MHSHQLLNKVFNKRVIISAIKYLLVGGSTFLLDYLLNWVLIYVVHIHYLVVGYISSPLVLLFNYYTHRVWTYSDVGSRKGKNYRQLAKYLTLVGFNLLANMVIMYVFYGSLELSLLATKVIGTALAITWNFPIQRYWVYRTKE